MKKFILITTLAILTLSTSAKAGWFNDDAQKEQERREHAEQQLQAQEQKNDGLGVAIVVLAVGVVGALVIGAAVGSKTRRAVKEP